MKKQTIYRVAKDKSNPYVMINKTPLKDEGLSWKAKGILSYLLSLPDDWQVYESELQNHASDGIDSLRSGMQELIQHGYVHRKRRRNEKGHLQGYEYVIHEVSTKSGLSKNGLSKNGLSKGGKPDTTNNDYNNNDYTNNDLSSGAILTKENIDLVIKEWNKLNLQNLRNINSNTKRHTMLKARIEEYSLDEVIQAIQSISKSSFLKGQNDRSWTITFDWLVKPNNFLKVIEGNYENQGNQGRTKETKPSSIYNYGSMNEEELEKIAELTTMRR